MLNDRPPQNSYKKHNVDTTYVTSAQYDDSQQIDAGVPEVLL